MRRVLISLFAKPPVAGTVKTRLARAIGDEAAARLAAGFLQDTWVVLGQVDADRQISTTVVNSDAFGIGPVDVFEQGEGDLGARIERTLIAALSTHEVALAVGADVPWMTADALAGAVAALEGYDAVLGPTLDGGFWCLGVRRMEAGWLAGLPWSVSETAEATLARLRGLGLRVGMLPAGWDVDEVEDLDRLRTWLDGESPAVAPATRGVLASLGG